jgi:predicted AlkP superfamily phosphohydrolase/phosphomutase
MHAGIYGFLYLNLAGRGPHGIVQPDEYEAVRDDLIERFKSAKTKTPAGETVNIFEDVLKTEALYNCTRDDNPDLPDLLLVPRPGLAVVRKIRGSKPVRWASEKRLEGTHRVEGIVAMQGTHIDQGQRINANIADLTPTALAMLGLRVPADMEGRVITEAFTTPITVEHEPPIERAARQHEDVYSEEDERILQQRLSDLGYLE